MDENRPDESLSLEPAAIIAVKVGKRAKLDVDDNYCDNLVISENFCQWLTKCFMDKMTPAHFQEIWEYYDHRLKRGIIFDEEKDELEATLACTENEFGEVPGKTPDGKYWHKQLNFWDSDLDIPAFYATSVEHNADKFIVFQDNFDLNIVALRGDPGAEAIELRVLLDTTSIVQDAKNRRYDLELTQWPPELGPGAPIQLLDNGGQCSGNLRDGTSISVRHIGPPKASNRMVALFINERKIREYKYRIIYRPISSLSS